MIVAASFAIGLRLLVTAPTGQRPFQPPTTCEPVAHVAPSALGFPEAQGTGADSSVWALFFAPLETGRDVKIAWRVTGSGRFTVEAFHPSGAHLSPREGPTPHEGSNWDRPGDEWGTFFRFPTTGCWDLHVTRGGLSADLWVEIKAASRAR